jgi:Cysteine-rich CPCC
MDEDVPPGDPWATTGVRLADFARLHDDGVLTEVPCLACGYPTLNERGGYHVCVVCHWEDDGTTRAQPDRAGGANHGLTLREATANIAESGVSRDRWDALTTPEYFLPAVRAARADLMAAYERLRVDPYDASTRAAVFRGRADLMRAIVTEMR